MLISADRDRSLARRALLVTEQLGKRRAKPRDMAGQISAFRDLSKHIAEDPAAALQRFLDLAVELCGAGSGGWSRLGSNRNGEQLFFWDALAGRFASYVGRTTPRHFSPCGFCLDAGATVLVSRPARVFTYFNDVPVPIVEALIVPVYDTDGQPLGTVWVVHNDEKSFDRNDAAVVEELAVQFLLALKMVAERQRSEREIAGIRAMVKDTDHRVKNTIQTISALLRLQANSCDVPEAKAALNVAHGRLEVFGKVQELLDGGDGESHAVAVDRIIGSIADGARRLFADRQTRVTLNVQAEALLMTSRRAVPLALLVNEAVTNAYKYAYPDGKAGVIDVKMARVADGRIEAVVRDFGVGIGENTRHGLGTTLIHSFATQLEGNLTVNSSTGSGTTVKLTMDDHSAPH